MTRKKEPDHYVYVETGSKNRSGGLKELNVENKVVPVYASPAAGERCLVYLLDLYLQKLPPIAFEKDWQPKQSVPESALEPWYACQPISLIRWWLQCAVKQVLVIEKRTIRSG